MESRDIAVSLAVLGITLLAVAALLLNSSLLYTITDPDPRNYETATVTLSDANGTDLATVTVRIADTDRKRYVGLSETAGLDPGEGMLFVHDGERRQAYVMRNMSFALDIVFVAANGTVTTVHTAPVPPDGVSGGDLTRYRGRAKYVLEVPRGYANATGLDDGDTVHVPSLV